VREPPAMDLCICGPLRSGTTMLADLLTVKGKSLVMSEPDFHVPWHGRTIERLHKLYGDVGLDIAPAPPVSDPLRRVYVDWFTENVLPQLQRLDLWGVKQVDFHDWEKLFKRFPPRRLVLVTRDLRDVSISALDLIARSLVAFPGGKRLRDEAWVLARLASDMHELRAMTKHPHLHIRYEDFVSESSVRERLRQFAGLDAFGKDHFNLDGENLQRSEWEKKKHGGKVTTAALGRFGSEPEGPTKGRADRLWRVLAPLSKGFGYDMPDAPVDGHAFVRMGEDDPNPVDRAQVIDAWNAKGPDTLEPAFALRTARIAAAQSLVKPCRVLDLFCGAPALRYLLKSGSVHRGADLALRYDGCEVFDLEALQLPPKQDSEIVTVLGALEYLPRLPGFLAALRALDAPILASYRAADDTPGTDRKALGWRNHLGRREISDMFTQAGFKTEIRWAFDGRQSLIKAVAA